MNYTDKYINFLEKFIDVEAKIKVAFDASNGAAGPVIEKLFKRPEVDPFFFNTNPDGDFPAHGPNPLANKAITDISKEVINSGADMGVIFDGDGDRVFFTDELGKLVDSYEVLRLIKDQFKPPYIVDIRAMPEFTMKDIDVVEEKAGRQFMIKAMMKRDADLAVEYTGHYYFKNFFYTDSGILASIYMINYLSSLRKENRKLSEVLKESKFAHIPEANFEVANVNEVIERVKESFTDEGVKIKELDGITIYHEDFALNLRPSVTEPLARLNMVAKDKKILDSQLNKVKKLIY